MCSTVDRRSLAKICSATPRLPSALLRPTAIAKKTHLQFISARSRPSIRELVCEVLTEAGYDTLHAGDGSAGLRILQSATTIIDLLITDVGLPGAINGRQMADAARITRPDLKILFMTGYAENSVAGNGHLETGMHILIKPFSLEVVRRKIRDILSD
jgi:DNA-binding response OmpR family regulator